MVPMTEWRNKGCVVLKKTCSRRLICSESFNSDLLKMLWPAYIALWHVVFRVIC